MKQTFEKTTVAMIMALVPLFVYGGDSAPFPLDTMDGPLVADSIDVTYDSSWIGGDALATAVIRDNGVEVRRTTGAGEFTHTPAGAGRHELTYTTLIGDVVQEEVYRAIIYKGKYTLHFDANGGEGMMADCEVGVEMPFTLPQGAFTKDGHFLLGWALTPDGNATLLDGDSTDDIVAAPGETVTLYAVWHEGNGEYANYAYAVSFNANGGEGAMPKRVYAGGDDVTLPAVEFERTGWTFADWALTPDGPVSYADGEVVVGGLDATGGQTKTLYARWGKHFSAHFTANGGTGEMEDTIYYIEDMSEGVNGLAVRYYDISSSGYSTWTQSEEAMTNYFASRTPTIEASTLDWGNTLTSGFVDAMLTSSYENQRISAGLAELEYDNCRFHGKYANGSQNYFSTYLTGNITIRDPGTYSFAAIADDYIVIYIDGMKVANSQWATIASGSISLASGNHTISIAFYEITGGQGLTVQWKKPGDSSYTPIPQSVLYQSMPGSSLPSCSFTKTGHSFLGWATEPNGEVAYIDREPVGHVFNDGDVTNVTLYAVWGINQYTVSFDSAQGSPVGSITQDYGSSIAPPANPTRTGYSFLGWQPELPATMPASNTVSTAQWELLTLSLDVASPFGTALPDVGRNLVSWGNRITARVTEPASAYGFRQHCTGWTGTGNVPASGTGTYTTFTIQENSSIIWNWERQTWHECIIAGDAAHKTESGWKTFNGADNVIHFSPNGSPYRYELSGDTNGVIVDVAAATVTLPTDRPRSVVLTVHVYTKDEVIEDGGTPFTWTYSLSTANSSGLSIRYYDISSSGYSTWTQSEAAMTNYFTAYTPTMETNTLDWGEILDAGFQFAGSSYDTQRIFPEFSNWSNVGTSNNSFHGKYANRSQNYYTILLEGWISIPIDGEYSFGTVADDALVLYIDGMKVCEAQWDNPAFGSIFMAKGCHRICAGYYEGAGEQGFLIQWKKPGDSSYTPIPQSVLSHESGWHIIEDASADDGFSLRSGIIGSGETSAIEAAVSGTGTLSFDWRISSARGHFARFYVDGVQQKSITRTMDWATVTATLDDGPHTLRWAYEKGTGETGGEDAAFLDNVVWTPLTLADALDTDAVVWTTDGAQSWFPEVAVTADGADAARSGTVTGLDVSALTATVLGAGTLTWSWMGEIAGNAGVDVFLDGEWCDSVWLEGDTDWETASLAIAGAGTHTVRFEFWNGGTADTLSDYAVIDQVSWSGTEARTLAVASAFGTASPAAGTQVLARGGQVAASVAAPEPTNGTRRVCTGWTGTGSVLTSGTAASVAFTLNEDTSIEWNWRTDYWTEITVSGGTCAFAPQWVAAGTQVEVAITASAHVPTVSLSGDTAGATLDGTTLRFAADRPRTIHVEVQETTFADLEMPDLSGPGGLSFGTDGSGNPTFNVRVANPVPGVYYTAFIADTLDGPFLADAASRLAEPDAETLLFALAAGDDRPSRFVRIVASTAPFAAGDPLPEEAGR